MARTFRSFVGLSAVGAALLACSKPAPAATTALDAGADASPSANTDACEGVFLSPPKNAVLLCDEHVVANGTEVHWRSYATTEPRAAVNARYRVATATCPYSLTFRGPIFSIAHERRRLQTYDAASAEPPSCAKKPDRTDKTVILVSESFDRP
jgi:hypothetical protein